MNYVGLDPSFTSSGLAIIDSSNHKIDLYSGGFTIGDKSFFNIVDTVRLQVNNLLSRIPVVSVIITETPPAAGNFSSGLYALDTHLVLSLKERCHKIYGVAPTYLGHLHRTRKYHKSDSVILARRFLEVFHSNGYTIPTSSRISSDKAEAFIFACRLFVINYRDSDIANQLLNVCKWLDDEKEFLL